MRRAGLLLLAVACSRVTFHGELFFCDDASPCADGYQCVQQTCVSSGPDGGTPDAGPTNADAGQCQAPDGGRGNCTAGAFCTSIATCDLNCTASRSSDFSQDGTELYTMSRAEGTSMRVNNQWLISAVVTDAGQAFMPANSALPAQPIGQCGFAFDVATLPNIAIDDGWQVSLRYQHDNNNWVGFILEQQQVTTGVAVDNQLIDGGTTTALGSYRRFAVRPKGDALVFYAAPAGGAWDELSRIPNVDLGDLGVVMWVGCFQAFERTCVLGESRQMTVASYNIDFPPPP